MLVLRPSYHLGYSPFVRNPLADTFDETAVDDLGAKEIRAVPRLERAVRELHALTLILTLTLTLTLSLTLT